ncbi:hypothetical protein LSAT2_013230 [Lamellibrachia satsuma]|nr:hypothetical protein LSAT2_013230 [Lamellibrachia satsuma]
MQLFRLGLVVVSIDSRLHHKRYRRVRKIRPATSLIWCRCRRLCVVCRFRSQPLPSSVEPIAIAERGSVSIAADVSVEFGRLSLRLDHCCCLRRNRPSVTPSRSLGLLSSPSHSAVCRSVLITAVVSVAPSQSLLLPQTELVAAASSSRYPPSTPVVVVCVSISVRTLPRRVGTKVRFYVYSNT